MNVPSKIYPLVPCTVLPKQMVVFVKIMPIIVRPFLLSSIFPFRDQQRFAFYDIWIGYMGYKILKKSFKSSQKAYPTFFVLLNLWAVEDVDWLKWSAAALCFDFKIRLNNWLAHQMKFYPKALFFASVDNSIWLSSNFPIFFRWTHWTHWSF